MKYWVSIPGEVFGILCLTANMMLAQNMNWTDSLLFAVALFTGLTGFALLCAGILGFQSCDVRFSIGGLVDALLTDGIITMVKDLFKN